MENRATHLFLDQLRCTECLLEHEGGGVDNSAHKIPVCKAADIKTPSIAIRNRIIKAAKEVGFTRIGIASTFVHLDNDTSKPQYVAWGYPPGNQPPVNPFG